MADRKLQMESSDCFAICDLQFAMHLSSVIHIKRKRKSESSHGRDMGKTIRIKVVRSSNLRVAPGLGLIHGRLRRGRGTGDGR